MNAIELLSPERLFRVVGGLLALLLVTGGCSVVDTTESERAEPVPTTSSSEPPAPTTTSPSSEPAADTSAAVVVIGDTTYDLAAHCYAPPDGGIIVTALDDPLDGPRIELYLQDLADGPYVAMSVITDTTVVFEPAIDQPLRFERTADGVRLDELAFVTGLDLETGVGDDAGAGSLEVVCGGYTESLPPGFAGG